MMFAKPAFRTRTGDFLRLTLDGCFFNRYNVAIVGSILVRTPSGEAVLPFRIEGKIDITAIRSNSCRSAALTAMLAFTQK